MNAAAKCMAPLIHGEGCECATSLSAWREKPVLFTPAPSPVFTNDVTKPTPMSCVTGATAMSRSSAMVSMFGTFPSFETRPRAVTMSYFPNTPPRRYQGHSSMHMAGSNCVGADFIYSDQELERQKMQADAQLRMMEMQQNLDLRKLYFNQALGGNTLLKRLRGSV